jgi:hypothetical protein
MPRGSGPGSIPSAFKVGEDSYIVPKGKGDIAFVGDEKEAGSLSKYEKLGYGIKSLPRSGGISGTKAREAIAANDIPALKKLLSPAGFEYVQKHMAVLQQRPKLLDAILSKIERNSSAGKGTAGRLSQVKSQLADLPSRISKTTPVDVVAKVESLRKERDALSSKVGRLPSKLMSRLEQRQRFGGGSSKPLESLGVSGLIEEGKKSGLLKMVPLGLRRQIDKRSKSFDQVVYDKLLKDLREKRVLVEAKSARISEKAKTKKIGVVGLFNSAGDSKPTSEEVVTPDVKGRKKRGEKTTKGFPATLETGVLPERDSKRVRAAIRRSMEQLTVRLGKIIGKSAGSQSVTDKKQIRDIVDVGGEIHL